VRGEWGEGRMSSKGRGRRVLKNCKGGGGLLEGGTVRNLMAEVWMKLRQLYLDSLEGTIKQQNVPTYCISNLIYVKAYI
jgi:hypothetical protein